jgi:hypothetical protein
MVSLARLVFLGPFPMALKMPLSHFLSSHAQSILDLNEKVFNISDIFKNPVYSSTVNSAEKTGNGQLKRVPIWKQQKVLN